VWNGVRGQSIHPGATDSDILEFRPFGCDADGVVTSGRNAGNIAKMTTAIYTGDAHANMKPTAAFGFVGTERGLMPDNGMSAVAAGTDWTPQEKFVWERVAAGKIADFNTTDGYGGDLDPKKPEGWPDNRVLRPAFLETILLKEAYLRNLTRRGVTIYGARFADAVELEGAELQNRFVLGKSLLEKGADLRRLKSKYPISLSGSKVVGALQMNALNLDADLFIRIGEFTQVDFTGAHVRGQLELDGSKVVGMLNMNGLRVERSLLMRANAEFTEVDLTAAHIGGQLELDSSKVIGKFYMGGLRVERSLLMRAKAEFTEVDLTAAHVGGHLELDSSKITGKLNMGGLRVEQNLLMRNKAEFAEVDLRAAHIGGQLELDTSKVAGRLNMNSLHVERNLLMRGNAEFAEVDLTAAHIGGQLELDTSRVTGKLNMNSLRVELSLLMRDKAEFAEVDLTGAYIGGQLELNGSKFTGKLYLNGLHVEQSLFMRDKAEFAEVDLTAAQIGGQLELDDSKVTGKLNMNGLDVEQYLRISGKAEFADVELTNAHVGGQLSLVNSKVNGVLNCDSVDIGGAVFFSRGATFLGPINLIFAKIGQNLELAGGTFGNQVDMTGARISGEFRLGSARHPPAIWLAGATLILRNAGVDSIQDLSDAWPARLDLNGFIYQSLGGINAAEKDPILERPAAWFKTWLAKQGRYAAQPYEQLASCLRNNGKNEMATAIRYAGSEREREESSGWWRRLWLIPFKYSVGYGYRPWRALGWAAALVLLGAEVLQISGEGLRNNMPYGLAYSFDMLLPIVKLREWHYKVDLMGWARYYFYGHKIMGYLLASFLIAGLSSLRAGGVSRE
jgi:hypothetical protein